MSPVVKAVTTDWRQERSTFERDIMLKHARRARFFTTTGFTVMFLSVCSILLMPIAGIKIRFVNNITDLADGRMLPVQALYPFDFADAPYYQLMYVLQLIASTYVIISFSVPDYFFGTLVYHISAQCEILGSRMSELLADEKEIINWVGSEKMSFSSKLKELVNMHVQLIRYNKRLFSRTFLAYDTLINFQLHFMVKFP